MPVMEPFSTEKETSCTAVISNLSVLFCTGLAAALAKQEKHQAAFIALMSYLVYLTAGHVTLTELGLLAQPDALTGLYSAGQTMVLGLQTVDTGVFGGILLGLLTAFVYDLSLIHIYPASGRGCGPTAVRWCCRGG